MSSLYIDRSGSKLKLQNNALVCYENEERIGTIPLAPIDRIYLKGDVTLQASLLAKLGDLGIGVTCLSGRKNIPTLFMSKSHNDASRRLNQYAVATNEKFCLAFAHKLILLKTITQKNWLWQASNARPDKKVAMSKKANELEKTIKKIIEQNTLPSLRGLEGSAASTYFTALSIYLPPALKFVGRNRRPPKDPFNAVLSLSYTLLHSEAVLAIYGAGLDPYIGFFHSIDFGRESLACDLIEPLRPVIDNWILGCFRDRTLRVEDFSMANGGCMLGKSGRIRYYQAYEKKVITWRKILTEGCLDLIHILQTYRPEIPKPQRKYNQTLNNIPAEINWEEILEPYFFNQKNMITSLDFRF